MKQSYFSLLFFLSGIINSQAQVMQASLGAGSSVSRIKIYVRPSAAVNGNISTFQFNIAIPASISPVPSLTFVRPPSFGASWQIDDSYLENGFRHYQVNSALGGNLVLGANTEFEVMELEFSGGPTNPSDVSLYTLPGGGNSGNALFLCTGAANSVEGQLYYARPNVVVVNNDSYTGVNPSSVTLANVALPVGFIDFTSSKVTCNSFELNWRTEYEANNIGFEIEMSADGMVYKKIGFKAGAGNRDSFSKYAFQVTSNSNISYFRLKQIDSDGSYTYSKVISSISDCKTTIKLLPNPTKDYFTINGLDNSRTHDIVIYDAKGSTVGTYLRTRQNNFNVNQFPSGIYFISIDNSDMIKLVKEQ